MIFFLSPCNIVILGFENNIMEESKRQRQVGRLIQEELSAIFLKEGLNMIQGGMVSISKVYVTPDLLEARVYLSFFKINDPEATLEIFKDKTGELRGILGNKLRHQLRRIPELQFIMDDTLDRVFRMEEIFKQIKEKK
jgi:ribosome-binding factor A